MLQQSGVDEMKTAAIDGSVLVRYEFSSQACRLDGAAVDALFTDRGRPMEAPERLQ